MKEMLMGLFALAAVTAGAAPSSYMAGKSFYVYSCGSVAKIGADGKMEWRTPAIRQVGDCWVTPKSILYTDYTGVRELANDKDRRELFHYATAGDPQSFGCVRLANGNVAVAETANARILEIKPDGTVARELKLAAKGGHGFMRGLRVTPQGNYLVGRLGAGAVEYDAAGKVVWSYKNPAFGMAYSAVRLANGNTMISWGQDAKAGLTEVTPDKKVVWSLTNADLAGQVPGVEMPLKFPTGFFVLPNGDILLTNWIGHGYLGKAPHAYEITRGKKIVWSWADHKNFPTVSNIYPLDENGRPLEGNGLH